MLQSQHRIHPGKSFRSGTWWHNFVRLRVVEGLNKIESQNIHTVVLSIAKLYCVFSAQVFTLESPENCTRLNACWPSRTALQVWDSWRDTQSWFRPKTEISVKVLQNMTKHPFDPCMLYMVTFTINIPPMLVYIPAPWSYGTWCWILLNIVESPRVTHVTMCVIAEKAEKKDWLWNWLVTTAICLTWASRL